MAMAEAQYIPNQDNPINVITWDGSQDRADFPATFQHYIDSGQLRFRDDMLPKGGFEVVAVIRTNMDERIAHVGDIIYEDRTGVMGYPVDPLHPGILSCSAALFVQVYDAV